MEGQHILLPAVSKDGSESRFLQYNQVVGGSSTPQHLTSCFLPTHHAHLEGGAPYNPWFRASMVGLANLTPVDMGLLLYV